MGFCSIRIFLAARLRLPTAFDVSPPFSSFRILVVPYILPAGLMKNIVSAASYRACQLQISTSHVVFCRLAAIVPIEHDGVAFGATIPVTNGFHVGRAGIAENRGESFQRRCRYTYEATDGKRLPQRARHASNRIRYPRKHSSRQPCAIRFDQFVIPRVASYRQVAKI
jgi:hypothetical protein